MTQKELEALAKKKQTLDEIAKANADILAYRTTEGMSLSIYTTGRWKTIPVEKVPLLKEEILELLSTMVGDFHEKLEKEFDELVLCKRVKEAETYRPVNKSETDTEIDDL